MLEFIPTDFGTKDEAAIEITDRRAGIVRLGFYAQNGHGSTQGMTAERAVEIGEALAAKGREALLDAGRA